MKAILILFILSVSAWGFDHSHKDWDIIVQRYVKTKQAQTYFAYEALKNDKKLSKSLNAYLATLSKVTKNEFKKYSKEQKLAFLINAYNAFTVKLIVDNYPIKSIKKLGSLFSSPWKKKFFVLFEKKRHLDYIEHDLIRKIFNEPRVHYAVNCASIGCPNLQNKAFTDKNLESLLAKGETEFFADKNKNYLRGNRIYVSPIFKWFTEDFDKKYGSLRQYLSTQLGTNKEEKASIIQGRRIKWTHYDWNLNKI